MIDVIASGVRLSTPLLLAGLGGYLSGLTGQWNIAMEGMMLLGAYFALMVAFFSGATPLGIVAAVAVGACAGLVLSTITLRLGANVFVVGIILNILASGLTAFLLGVQFDVQGSFSDQSIARIPSLSIPVVQHAPFVGEILGEANLLTYAAILLFGVMWWVVQRTPYGLHIRVSGDSLEALRSAGLNADRIRLWAQVAGGGLCGLAGAYLSLGQLTLFSEDMSAGRGFVALAAVIFAGPHLGRLFALSLGFGILEAWAIDLQGTGVPPQFAQMLPYAATLAALVFVSVRGRGSGSLVASG